MVGLDILLEIDSTLDQLILNAETIHDVDVNELNETEIDAFQKTQESLLQHLTHMDQRLVQKRESLKVPDTKSASFTIQQKLLRFEKLKNGYSKTLSERQKRPILAKRRTKKLLVLR